MDDGSLGCRTSIATPTDAAAGRCLSFNLWSGVGSGKKIAKFEISSTKNDIVLFFNGSVEFTNNNLDLINKLGLFTKPLKWISTNEHMDSTSKNVDSA